MDKSLDDAIKKYPEILKIRTSLDFIAKNKREGNAYLSQKALKEGGYIELKKRWMRGDTSAFKLTAKGKMFYKANKKLR